MRDRSKSATILALKEVGRYAVGISWSDGHESILPLRHLRENCPCEICAATAGVPAMASRRVAAVQKLGEENLFLRWDDGHETLFAGAELRELCRCAYCAGEPNYPITGQ